MMPKAALVDRPTRRARRAHLRAERPLLSLAMIVRNEAEGLARCLASVAGAVDEIVIVDTGSTDETAAIAARFTDKIAHFAWCDDFSAARQYAFDLAAGEWVLWLDGDDELTGSDQLRQLCRLADPATGAIGAKYITGRDERGNVTQEFWRERIVRRGHYRWHGRVHEVLETSGPLRQIETTGFTVQHHGKGAAHAGGLARNIGLLRAQLAGESPPVPRTLFYLARDLMNAGELGEAESTFVRYLTVASWVEERYMAGLLLARLYLLRGESGPAHKAALAALGEWPAWPQAYFLLAETAYYRREWNRVIAWCDIGRGLPIPDTGLFVDPLALRAGWIIYYTNALYHAGLLGDAVEWTKRALQLLPGDLYHQRNSAFFASLALGVTGLSHRDVEPLAAAPVS